MRVLSVVALALALAACRDLSRFSSHGDRFEGPVVTGSFVRSGIGEGTTMCLTLDTEHLQDGPGVISTSDGRFDKAPLRQIPQIWHDPLSTMSFGEAREKNLVYAVRPSNETVDAFVVVSLMQSGGVEVRVLRGAPDMTTTTTDAGTGAPQPIFGVFSLDRRDGACGT